MGRFTRRWFGTLLPLLVSAAASCATSGAQSSTLGDVDFITRDEIQASPARNAYDLVQSLRPQWFRTRGMTNIRQAAGEEDIVIYMDNARLGERDALQRVPLGNVEYLQFFTAREATQRWGGGHLHGAILISTQSR